MSETGEIPVGEHPPQGGRVKQYENAAARARAWRERQKTPPESFGPSPVAPEAAQSALGAVLERIAGSIEERRRQDDDFATRVEAALAGVTDPDAVASTLEACRTGANEEVAAAEARMADAEERRLRAEAETRAAVERAEEAIKAADALDERLQEIEAQRQAMQGGWEAEQASRAVDAEAHATERNALQAELAETRQSAIDRADERDQARTELATALEHCRSMQDNLSELASALDGERTARARAEGEASTLRSDLERARTELAEVRSEIPQAIEAARDETRRILAERHALELDAAAARSEGEIARVRLEASEAHRAAVEELLSAYRPKPDDG